MGGTLAIISGLYMAIPIGIVGNAFSSVWEGRQRFLTTRRLRTRLVQAGFTAEDMPEPFYMYDGNKDGVLERGEFRDMLDAMKLDLGTSRFEELFKAFDDNGDRRIDDEEFVRFVW